MPSRSSMIRAESRSRPDSYFNITPTLRICHNWNSSRLAIPTLGIPGPVDERVTMDSGHAPLCSLPWFNPGVDGDPAMAATRVTAHDQHHGSASWRKLRVVIRNVMGGVALAVLVALFNQDLQQI